MAEMKSIGCFLVCLAAGTANATAATVFLDESSDPSAFRDGRDYFQVALSSTSPGIATITVTPEYPFGFSRETGIVDFAFDYSGPHRGAVTVSGLPPHYSLSQSSGEVGDFGRFTFDVEGKKPQSSLSFTLSGLAGSSPQGTLSYLEQLSTGHRNVTREDFVVEVAGLNTGAYCAPGDVYFGGQAAAPVPEPSTWALILSGFGVLGVWAKRRRNAGNASAGALQAA
jgi:PEP-CTERM motif-containing protein